MSDPLPEIPELRRPDRAPGLRDRLTEWAESLDLTPGRALAGVIGLVIVGLVGWRLLAPSPPPPESRLPFVTTTAGAGSAAAAGAAAGGSPGTSQPGGAGTEVVVHVAGAVAAPGVHHLPTGSRVVDAVDAAGGAAADADLGRLNLAALLEDGQRVYVPRVGEDPPPVVSGGTGGGAGSGGTEPGTPVNLNTATIEELEALPGVGPSIAQAIVAYREEHGGFGSVDELLEVRGIGDARFEQLRPLVTV